MTSIQEIRVDMLGLGLGRDDTGVRRALERAGCTVREESSTFVIIFPPNTMLYELTAPHHTLSRESWIQLPDETVFQIWRHYPCRTPGCTHTRLMLAGSQETHHKREKGEVRNGSK
jgi:hypothetical protein